MAKKKKRDWRRVLAKGKRARAKKQMDRVLGNPPKMRKISKTTGWINATAVRFVKRRGKPVEVLVRRSPRRKRKK